MNLVTLPFNARHTFQFSACRNIGIYYFLVGVEFKRPQPVKSENLQLFCPQSRNSREFPGTGLSAPRNWRDGLGVKNSPQALVRSFTFSNCCSALTYPAAAAEGAAAAASSVK